MPYIFETPYSSLDDESITVTSTESTIDLINKIAVIHNTGPGKLYYSGKSGVSISSPELSLDEKTFPRTGKLYVKSNSSCLLKIEYLNPVR